MNKVIAELQSLVTKIAGMEGQEPAIKVIQDRLVELYAEDAETNASYRSSRN